MSLVFTSPLKKKMIAELKKKKLVLLQIEGPDKEQNYRFKKAAERGAKMALDMAKKSCAILTVSLSDSTESSLVNNVFVGKGEKKPGILIVFGKGKGLYFIDDPEAYQIILDTAQMLDNTTDAEPQKLWPRLLLDMPYAAPKL